MEKLEDIKGVKFCHYTTLDNARKIISNEKIFLGKMEDMNDISESQLHEKDTFPAFSTCFCHSEAKSIPMFYLYSGIDGKGCRLEFTPAKLRSMLQTIEVYPVNDHLTCLKKQVSPEIYEVSFDWVHYTAYNGFEYYRGKEEKTYDSFEAAANPMSSIYYFVKNPVWRYEHEFRIVIRMKKAFRYKRVAINVPCKAVERGISITCGPELDPDTIEEVRTEFAEYGIQNVHSFSNEKIKIKMGLVERNKHLLK